MWAYRRPIREGSSESIDLLELPGEPGRVQERAKIKSYEECQHLRRQQKGEKWLTVVIWAVLFLLRIGEWDHKHFPNRETYSVIGRSQGSHLMPIPGVLEEEMLDLIRNLYACFCQAPF